MNNHPIQDILDEIVMIKNKGISMRRSLLIQTAFDWIQRSYKETGFINEDMRTALKVIQAHCDANVEEDILIIK